MIDLLIRLQELRRHCSRVCRNPQLTQGEKAAFLTYQKLVRDCLPAVVLDEYDHLRTEESELMKCPEIFAMTVLVSVYWRLTPRRRNQLCHYFDVHPLEQAICSFQHGAVQTERERSPLPPSAVHSSPTKAIHDRAA